MTVYGVTADGFVVKPLEAIKADVEAAIRARVDAGIILTTDTPDGQTFLIFCEQLVQMWELAASVGSTMDPAAAIGIWLDNLSTITGTERAAARKSTVVENVTVSQAVSIGIGAFAVSVAGNPASRFVNTEAIVTGAAGTVAIDFEGDVTGPLVANAGTLTVIETPAVGVTSVTNPLDAAVGSNIEDDQGLRPRREAELDAVGSGTVDSIRARLIKPIAKGGAAVDAARVFENVTDVTDINGVPPHSIRAVVVGGADAAIWQVLWNATGGGIRTFGSHTGTATDSAGGSQSVSFDRATELTVYLEVDIDVIAANYPTDGDDQVAQLLVNKGNELTMGREVVAERLRAEALRVSGVYDVTALRLGLTASPVGTINIPVDFDEIAKFDTGRVLVNPTPVVP